MTMTDAGVETPRKAAIALATATNGDPDNPARAIAMALVYVGDQIGTIESNEGLGRVATELGSVASSISDIGDEMARSPL